MSRSRKEALEELGRVVAMMGKFMPHASDTEVATLALQWLQLEAMNAQTAALRDAGNTASKVLEVLLKQYSRIALATHEGSVRDG
jgi:hypothetical protein